MGAVRVEVSARTSVHQAQQAWCDTDRWPNWVEGLEIVESVDPRWPEAGAIVRWRSSPAGRGEVVEQIVRHEPLELVESEIEDAQVIARQRVSFLATGGPSAAATEISIEFAYRIRRRSPLTPLVDVLFVRGAMRRSLQGTLGRFARSVEAAPG